MEMSDDLQCKLDDAASTLGEHFSSILILASIHEADKEGHFTDGLTATSGDHYAHQGMARIYVEKDNATRIAKAIVNAQKQP